MLRPTVPKANPIIHFAQFSSLSNLLSIIVSMAVILVARFRISMLRLVSSLLSVSLFFPVDMTRDSILVLIRPPSHQPCCRPGLIPQRDLIPSPQSRQTSPPSQYTCTNSTR
jgi:hypothetical protein